MKKIVVYGLGLIGLYIAVEYSTGSGILLDKGSSGVATITKALQGR